MSLQYYYFNYHKSITIWQQWIWPIFMLVDQRSSAAEPQWRAEDRYNHNRGRSSAHYLTMSSLASWRPWPRTFWGRIGFDNTFQITSSVPSVFACKANEFHASAHAPVLFELPFMVVEVSTGRQRKLVWACK